MPEESMVETPAMLIRTLVAPLFITSCTALRNCTSPEPMVILPLRSRMVTSPTCRLLTSILQFPPLVAGVAGIAAGFRLRSGEALAQRHHGAAAGAGAVDDVVHEASHVEDAAAVRAEQVLRGQRIAEQRGVEPHPLVLDPDHHVAPLNRQVDV